ncbi:Protein LHCP TRANSLOCATION DEFECT [Dichanthelium oligosanthes]|uniref:Protein LHCP TRANSLOCATION DEFECT n=1 Tax=Dichanthelium oligosanthes TaxID=888268 RepID=A0A1E5WIQ8_9POAL|nr:Protein LHCP TRANSLOCATION DEFECT [Dichanthelium oligosanthes]
MASIPCTFQLSAKTTTTTASRRVSPRAAAQGQGLRTPLLGSGAARRGLGWLRPSRLSSVVPASESGRVGPTCWFKFGNKDAEGAGIYGSQARDDFDRDDVEQYFNYMGMLAVEGTYDKMEALLNQNIHPVDILLMLAASEGDRPKIEELLRAGAKYDVKDVDGRTALDRASDETREFILGLAARKV